MPFDNSPIADVLPRRADAELSVSWSSTAPAGTVYQVYLNRVLAWHGTRRYCVLPHPTARARIDVGAVLAAEARTDFSASLPSVPGGGQRITLAWVGGSYLGGSIEGFRVYLGLAPGGAVSYARPVATISAYTGHVTTDGYGLGGYNLGVYGLAASNYTWTSGPLAPGTWNTAVVPFDTAGNDGAIQTAAVTLAGPPGPPTGAAYILNHQAPGGYGSGGYDVGGYGVGTGYNVGGYGVGPYGTGEPEGLPFVTLSWIASPG